MEVDEYNDEMIEKLGPKHCLVTGGAGFVGTNLIKRLLRDGHTVVSVDNYSTGTKDNHQPGAAYFEGDISDATTWDNERFKQCDIVFHMAALARIKPSFENPTEVIKSNVSGTANTLQFTRDRDIPMIYAGSSSFHGGVYKNPYTFAKWVGEELCKMYSKVYDVPTIITRFYNVYGDHMIPEESAYSTVIQIFNEQYQNNLPLTITGDGNQRRDFTHVLDICDALVSCKDHPELKAEFFELGSGVNYSINEVADMYKTSKTYIPQRPGEADKTLASFSKATKVLNYNPKRNLEDYINKIIKSS